jgi:hypothetical protein
MIWLSVVLLVVLAAVLFATSASAQRWLRTYRKRHGRGHDA